MLDKIRSALLNKFKQSIDDYPNENETDYGFIKEMIASIPDEKIKDASEDGSGRDLTEQEVIDMFYNSALQELVSTINCNVYYDEKKIRFTPTMFREFLRDKLDTDKFQKNNVLLTTDLWLKAMLSPKTTIGAGFFKRSVSYDKHRINYTELSTCNTGHKRRLPVLTTVQFDFDSNPDATISPAELVKESRVEFEELFTNLANSSRENAIIETADYVQDFSIHKYLVPAGVDDQSIESCSLLVRYDHCSKKHKNGSMPKLYRNVYPQSVEEPHIHFNSGFGSLYKLDKNEQEFNYGVGYAIGITQLREYLSKLYNETFKDKKERELYMNNDFGMPFLHIKKLDIQKDSHYLKSIVEALDMLVFTENVSSSSVALEHAYHFINLISATKAKSLYYKHSEYNFDWQDNNNLRP